MHDRFHEDPLPDWLINVPIKAKSEKVILKSTTTMSSMLWPAIGSGRATIHGDSGDPVNAGEVQLSTHRTTPTTW